MRLCFCLLTIVGLRLAVFIFLVTIFGEDPGTDTRIFEFLANKDWQQHISGVGERTQFPVFSPIVFSAIRFLFEPLFGQYWSRAAFVVFELCAYSILYLRVAGFSKSWFDYLYILGFFTGPLTALWAQDEMMAVIPMLLLFTFPTSLISFLCVVLVSFLLLKSFYLFAPLSRLWIGKPRYISLLALSSVAFMVLIDNTGDFVPRNHFSSTLWTFSSLAFDVQKVVSLAVFALFIAIALGVGVWRNLSWQIIYLAVFGAFLNTFYHINMEYFVFLTLPAMVVALKKDCSLISIVLICAWFACAVGSNLFYAVGYSLASVELARLLHTIVVIAGGILGFATFVSLLSGKPKTELA